MAALAQVSRGGQPPPNLRCFPLQISDGGTGGGLLFNMGMPVFKKEGRALRWRGGGIGCLGAGGFVGASISLLGVCGCSEEP